MGANFGLTSSRVGAPKKDIELKFIEPSKPQLNGLIERINCTCRHKVLNACIFESLEQVRGINEGWIKSYNQEDPHAALGKLAPVHYRYHVEKSNLVVNNFNPLGFRW